MFSFPRPQFYYFPSSMFLFPPPKFYYSPSLFLNSLPFHNINLSPPPPHTFVNPPPSQFLFSLLNLHLPLPSQFYYLPPPPPPLHLFYILFHYSIYIDLLSTLHQPYIDCKSTPHRPYNDPTSTLHRPHFDPISTLHRPDIDPTSIPHRPYIAPTSTPYQPYIDPTSTPHRPHIDPRLTFFKHSLVNSEYIQPPHFSLHNFLIPSSTILLFFLFNVFIPSSTFLLATLNLGGRWHRGRWLWPRRLGEGRRWLGERNKL